ncbi:uncharacterized protein LOC112044338 [Bicyclus anynana]|uniref:Uncharacterized protein LOC112044338 n=1 Tax=Bicyclus anynana TaxID=110368 RepID=A0A6J1MZC4_BICAN|nr:uncharacterized protein LOC112044338 [Bicyclus anynana]
MASTSTGSGNKQLEGWTKVDKFQLLQAFKKVGSNVELIKEMIPYKTEAEIIEAVGYYKGLAYAQLPAANPPPKVNKRKSSVKVPSTPLSEWAKLILDTHGTDGIQTATADALRLIAEYENRSDPIFTENIDFKKAYLMLADALEGKPIPDDKDIQAVFDKCIAETALTARELLKGNPALRELIQSLGNPATEDSNKFAKPTEDAELTILRELITKMNYNPLNISEANLKFPTNAAKLNEEE